jgi:hypothetical protein
MIKAQPQREIRRRQRPRHRDGFAAKLVERHRLTRHDHRPVAIPHARPARAQGVQVGEIGVAVQANGRQFEFARECTAIERLDVDQLVRELKLAGVDLAVGKGVEHERVVGVGAVADANEVLRGAHGMLETLRGRGDREGSSVAQKARNRKRVQEA